MQMLPVIPLRGVVVLPGEIIHCDASRKKTLAAMQASAAGEGIALFLTQMDAQVSDPTADDLYQIGTVCQIKQIFRIQGEGLHMLVTGVSRASVSSLDTDGAYLSASIIHRLDIPGDPTAIEALRRRVLHGFESFNKFNARLTADQQREAMDFTDPGKFSFAIAKHTISGVERRIPLLEEDDIVKRLVLLDGFLTQELQVQRLDQELSQKVRARVEKNQKEYYLREKIKVIHEELGEEDTKQADEYQQRMESKELPDAVRARLEKELRRLRALPGSSHELPMAHAYIECLLELPWLERTQDDLDINHARDLLDRDHYGMKKVKERILEYLAVQQLTGKQNGQILCMVGPPGVGKTSIAAAIAEAMGRKFVRMSLGGIHDEAEIRGHRRTYIGAMPGRVIAAMRQAGSINPVLLFDEIDKLGADHRGDPTAAMLEVLDSAQNNAFRDHFLELPFDLSQAMVLTTANDADAIPRPLYDRMEILEVPGYLVDEKLEIAKQHLLPRQRTINGLKKSNLRIADEQITALIEGYTRESGVRTLERTLGTVCRKAACEIVAGKSRIVVSGHKLVSYLGQPRYLLDDVKRENLIGVVTGLAWTAVGGETLTVEANIAPGTGSLQLTGHLGDVMQESGRAAMAYVRAHSKALGLPDDFYQKLDIHIHVPQGAVPKDGPSAGITMTTALVSVLTDIPVCADVAMTGEITLSGRVLPIGGLREKLLAAVRMGCTSVILPEKNRKDCAEIPQSIISRLSVHYVKSIDEVLRIALTHMPNSGDGSNVAAIYAPQASEQHAPSIICRKEHP